MVRTVVYLLLAFAVLGTIVTPGLGAFALVAVLLWGLGFIWRVALTFATRGRPVDAVLNARPSHLLGPGGPNDPFAVVTSSRQPDREGYR